MTRGKQPNFSNKQTERKEKPEAHQPNAVCHGELWSLPGNASCPVGGRGGGGSGGREGGCGSHFSLASAICYRLCRTSSSSRKTEPQGSDPRSGKQRREPRAHGSATPARPGPRRQGRAGSRGRFLRQHPVPGGGARGLTPQPAAGRQAPGAAFSLGVSGPRAGAASLRR